MARYAVVTAIVAYLGFHLWRAYRKGRITGMSSRDVIREDDPGGFWLTVVIYAAVAVACLIYAVSPDAV